VKGFILSRLLGGIVTIFVSTIIIFTLVRVIPGDPIGALLGQEYNAEVAASLRRLYGLEKPVHEQYVSWISAVAQGDLGFSLLTRASVASQVAERVPRTLYLMSGGAAVGIALGFVTGTIAAIRRGGWVDATLTSATSLLMSVPQFWLGMILIIVFGVELQWLPAAGYVSPAQGLWLSVRTMILPWLTVGLVMAAFVGRVLRSSLLDALSQDYITTARSRGSSERRVILRQAMRNAAIPAVTVVGLEIGYLMGGAIVVEIVFAYPGMGQLIVSSIGQRDYPVIQASLLFFALSFVVINLLADAAYGLLDPRIRKPRR
jgi:peptide/nickel transport system permease protein